MATIRQRTRDRQTIGYDGRAADDGARAPETPTALRSRTWRGVFKRTVTEFRQDNLTDLAAALTYYGILAIFPAIIALVSILGLIGQSATSCLSKIWTRWHRVPQEHLYERA